MIKRKRLYIVLCLLVLHRFGTAVWAADWGFRGLLPRGTGYYDKSSIKKINDDIRQVWIVTIYNEKGKEDSFLLLKKHDKAPDHPGKLNQESTLLEFDCRKKKFRIIALNIYDDNDHLLFAVPDIDSGWNDITAGSVNEKLKKAVCGRAHDGKGETK